MVWSKFSVHIGIFHEARKEIINISFSLIPVSLNQFVKRHGHACGCHGETLGCKTYKHIRRRSALHGCLNLCHGIVIIACIDRLHENIRVLCIKIRTYFFNQLRCGTAYINRVIKCKVKCAVVSLSCVILGLAGASGCFLRLLCGRRVCVRTSSFPEHPVTARPAAIVMARTAAAIFFVFFTNTYLLLNYWEFVICSVISS